VLCPELLLLILCAVLLQDADLEGPGGRVGDEAAAGSGAGKEPASSKKRQHRDVVSDSLRARRE
jgi:hypothetical protein